MNFNLRGLAATRPAVWLVLLVIASVSLLLWPTTALLAGVWSPISDNVLSHAWLVVAVVLWGVLREAAGLPRLTGRRLDVLSIVTIVALSLLWGFAKHAALLIPQQLLWFALLLTGLWTVLGAAAARALLRPLWILGWLMPVWALPHGFLWFTSTRAVRAILELIGLPAYFEGNVIHLASGSIQIASGCAGVAFFAAALSTAAIIGYLNRASLAQHAVLLGVAAAVAMVSNWLRIVIIVVEAHRTQMQTTLITKDHYVFGWILFAIALMAYCFAFASYGLRRGKPVPTVAPDAPPPQKFDLTRLAIGLAGLAVGPLAVSSIANFTGFC